MELKLIRSVKTPTRTLGKLYVNGQEYGFTCEDVIRELGAKGEGKVAGKTAIPAGKYEVVLSFSNRFQKYLPLLLSVPFFEGIRIHGGNNEEDSLGCLLVGAEGNMKDKIWNCASKITGLVALLKSVEKTEKTWIEIVSI